ncbi:MAG: TonB-dependent receptor [Bacteroidetes bacterium]|nr:TonB-dependent receptor [Bacteroidota bacterium]
MKRLIFIFHLTLAACWTFGQEIKTDSVYTLPHVEITSSRLKDFTVGQKTEQVDSTVLSASGSNGLGEVLYRNTTLNINRYNLNGLNLLSVRGTSSSQSSIFWNGVQINPPNNGMSDLALIPGNYFNRVKVLYGGSSSLYGSGNIGAGIHLDTEPVFRKINRLEFGASAGSFEDYSAYLKGVYASGKWYLNTQVMGRHALNDFDYTNLAGEQESFQNAALSQKGFMQDVYYKFNRKSVAGISFWYQENDKEIPATLTSKPSDAQQLDRSLRGIASFRHYYTKGQLVARFAVFNDYEHYLDPDGQPVLVIDSEIETTRIQGELSGKKLIFKKTLISVGLEASELIGQSVNYSESVRQKQGAVYVLLTQSFPHGWKINANLRQELNSDYSVPITPAVGAEGRMWKNLSARATISRNFRVPTFNDLYWIPGGNPDLKPESSWNEEIGLIYKTDTSAFITIKTAVTAFNSNVENWIMWVPDGNLWMPQNIQKVWARGLEADLELGQYLNKVRWSMRGGYSYTSTTNEKKLKDNDPTYQKQLTYVPYHRAHFNFLLAWKGWTYRADQAITGKRYVTADNLEEVDGYSLLDMNIEHRLLLRKDKLVLRLSIQNLLDAEYQAVQYFPMPGRSFNLSINLIIQ